MTDVAANPLKRSGDEPVAVPSEPKKPRAVDDLSGGGMDIDDDDDEEDEMAGLDESNIISGSRTRGKKIDFTKAIELEGDDDDEEDEDVVLGDETIELDDDGEEESNEEEEEGEEEEVKA